MKTKDAEQLDFNQLGDALVSSIGGNLHVYDSDHGLILNREFITEKHTHFLEITREYKNNRLVYNLVSQEKEKGEDIVFNSFKLLKLDNLYVTVPNIILGEGKKISFLTRQNNRFLVVDLTDNIGVNIIYGLDRREPETEEVPHEKRRKFIRL